MTKILVTGHLGYVGAALLPLLRQTYPSAEILGIDTGFFEDDLWGQGDLPESVLDNDIRADLRSVETAQLRNVDTIIHLASVSNDPIGKSFAHATQSINEAATIKLARVAQTAGVQRFIFASSCSIYGATENMLVDETAKQNPLTEYARSKVAAETALVGMASADFQVTSLRFGTACGYSKRLRLDLVVNDFVATAVATNKIELLSSGQAWRPFIHVDDMSRAICWAIQRHGPDSEVVNIGSGEMCLSVAELAQKVADYFPDSKLVIPTGDMADNRSYRVSFEKFRNLAPEYQPLLHLEQTITDLKTQLEAVSFSDDKFREGPAMRLNKLKELQSAGKLNDDLKWAVSF